LQEAFHAVVFCSCRLQHVFPVVVVRCCKVHGYISLTYKLLQSIFFNKHSVIKLLTI
jgi:hypothetical protein